MRIKGWKNYWKASLRPRSHHSYQLNNVAPSHALPLVVCILMLSMLVVAVEHVQLATMYQMNPIDRCSHMTFSRASLVLPSLDNVLPAMVLQNRVVRVNTGYMLCSSSYSIARCVSSSLDLKMYSSLGSRAMGVVMLLLLWLSGDIELNPGPFSESMESCKIYTCS